jgi:hypothetical protein
LLHIEVFFKAIVAHTHKIVESCLKCNLLRFSLGM